MRSKESIFFCIKVTTTATAVAIITEGVTTTEVATLPVDSLAKIPRPDTAEVVVVVEPVETNQDPGVNELEV